MTAKARSLKLHQLEVFAAAAREHSFTGAARVLLLTEPAVSQQVKLLEATVGAQLFERRPRRPIRLTDAGWLLLRTCESVFQEFEATLKQIEALQSTNPARVSLAVGSGFGSYLLPGMVAAFRQGHPSIPVTVNIEAPALRIEKVRRREADLAVITGDVDEQELTSLPLAEKDLVWIALSGHRLANAGTVAVEALRDERLIIGSPPSAESRALDWIAETYGVVLHPAFELAGTEACVTAALSGMGVALVPYSTVLSRELSQSVAVLDVEGFPLRLNWSLVWRTDDLSPAGCAFRDHLLGGRRRPVAPQPEMRRIGDISPGTAVALNRA
ncbi:MAG TPA: LysR family transcriptional regulator [Dehalococcoidia bacterium]|nr:LysR family transcriptional regulator [Dehalococcoidia bacterium]